MHQILDPCLIKSAHLKSEVGLTGTILSYSLSIRATQSKKAHARCSVLFSDDAIPLVLQTEQRSSLHDNCQHDGVAQHKEISGVWTLASSVPGPDGHATIVLIRRMTNLLRDFSTQVRLPVPMGDVDHSSVEISMLHSPDNLENQTVTGLEEFPTIRRSHIKDRLIIEASSSKTIKFNRSLIVRHLITENHRALVNLENSLQSVVFPPVPKFQRPINKLAIVGWGNSPSEVAQLESRRTHLEAYLQERQPLTISLVDLSSPTTPTHHFNATEKIIAFLNESEMAKITDPEAQFTRLQQDLPKNRQTAFDLIIASDDIDNELAASYLEKLRDYSHAQIYVLLNHDQWTTGMQQRWTRELGASIIPSKFPDSPRPFRYEPWSISSNQSPISIDRDWIIPADGFHLSDLSYRDLNGKIRFVQGKRAEPFLVNKLSADRQMPSLAFANQMDSNQQDQACNLSNKILEKNTPSSLPDESILEEIDRLTKQPNPSPLIDQWIGLLGEYAPVGSPWHGIMRHLRTPPSFDEVAQAAQHHTNLKLRIVDGPEVTIRLCDKADVPDKLICNRGIEYRNSQVSQFVFRISSNQSQSLLRIERQSADIQRWGLGVVELVEQDGGMEKINGRVYLTIPPGKQVVDFELKTLIPSDSNEQIEQQKIALANTLIQSKRYLDALQELATTPPLKDPAKSAERLHLQGITQMRLGNFRIAIQYLTEARSAAPQRNDIAYNLACAMALNGDFELSVQIFEALRGQSPQISPEIQRLIQFANQDPDLIQLRNTPRWRQFIEVLKAEME